MRAHGYDELATNERREYWFVIRGDIPGVCNTVMCLVCTERIVRPWKAHPDNSNQMVCNTGCTFQGCAFHGCALHGRTIRSPLILTEMLKKIQIDNLLRFSSLNRLFYRLLFTRGTGEGKTNRKHSSAKGFDSKIMCSNLCQALLLSSSNCYGYSMLEFAKEEICAFLKQKNVEEIIFLPYAQNDYDGYTARVKEVLEPWGFKVSGAHTYTDLISTLNCSKAIFVGGGNTFLLLKSLYDLKILAVIRERVTYGKLLYIGSSAGTNVATRSIHTTNDMPITYPPTFDAIGLVPFNINPHYVSDVSETHKGETRDQRIGEYLEINNAAPVLGLREGSILRVNGTTLLLTGVSGAVLFRKAAKKAEFPIGSDMSFLLNKEKEK